MSDFEQLKSVVDGYPWPSEMQYTMIERVGMMQGEAFPALGAIAIHDEVTELDARLYIAAHERAHLNTGRQFRQIFQRDFPEIDNYTQDAILTGSNNAELAAQVNYDYLLYKTWAQLYSAYSKPEEINLDDRQEVMRNYFELASRGMIGFFGGTITHHSPKYMTWDRDVHGKPQLDVSDLRDFYYGRDVNEIILTGYFTAEQLINDHLDSLGLRTTEEGLAYFAASEFTGIPLERAASLAPENVDYIAEAHRIRSIGKPAGTILEIVRTYDDLRELV